MAWWDRVAALLPAAGSFQYYLLRFAVMFLAVAVCARLLTGVIRRTVLSRRRLLHRRMSERRLKTLRFLIGSIMNGLAVLVTLLLTLGMFVQPDALFTTLGLFSAALGFGARPYVSDFLGGIALLFEDQFALGDKVEIGDRQVIGVVERVTLRTTYVRGEAGELWLVPNGDVRTIRNFSRGIFSPANLKLTVPTIKLDETLVLLSEICVDPGPDVLEPPEIISEDGEMGADSVTLTLKVKAKHGSAPLVRRRLLARLQASLSEHHVLTE
ncbi:MAG TPA: mechanosensitive ion channel domain-containing protein [Herpetosiphonaceae bacterium]